MRKLLILDCDGVLYPASNIVHNDFVEALQKTNEIFLQKITNEERNSIKNGADMWNVLRSHCKKSGMDFDILCKKMVSHINYKKIRKTHKLLPLINRCKKDFDIVVLSDNHYWHIENVLQHRFGMSISDFAKNGITVFDITSTEAEGRFWPKRTSDVLTRFCKKNHYSARNCIFVDNCKLNIEAGSKIGMKTVFITPRYTLQKFLKSLDLKN